MVLGLPHLRVACQIEHGYPTDQWGIKVCEVGPWKYGEKKWQYAYLPVPTDNATCARRAWRRGTFPRA